MGYGILILLASLVGQGQADQSSGVDEANRLLRSGRYAEAEEAFEAAAKVENPTPELTRAVALGKAESLAERGEYDDAVRELDALANDDAGFAKAWSRLAEIHFNRGRWEEADAAIAKALEADPNDLLARWIAVRLLDARGELEKAVEASKWFIDWYNDRHQEVVKDADALVLIGQAAERYYRASARGEELSDALNDVINEIYEGAIKADPLCWKAPWLEGRLFLSGYNERAATKELARALQINPLSPEVLVTLGQADLQGYRLSAGRSKAERALEINPRYVPALVLLADLNISDERFPEALEAAKKAAVENPRDEDALARLAASSRLLVDPVGAAAAELEALAQNPLPRPSTPPWESGWPTAASTSTPSARFSWRSRPTPDGPTPPSAWECFTCRSDARPRPEASSTTPSPPTRSTSAPTT